MHSHAHALQRVNSFNHCCTIARKCTQTCELTQSPSHSQSHRQAISFTAHLRRISHTHLRLTMKISLPCKTRVRFVYSCVFLDLISVICHLQTALALSKGAAYSDLKKDVARNLPTLLCTYLRAFKVCQYFVYPTAACYKFQSIPCINLPDWMDWAVHPCHQNFWDTASLLFASH